MIGPISLPGGFPSEPGVPIRIQGLLSECPDEMSGVLCDERMRTGYRTGASQNGVLPVIEPASNVPEDVMDATAVRQMRRELEAARHEARRLRTDARNRAAEMKTEALRERIEYRAAAERQIDKLRQQAELDADAIRASATGELERIKAEAEGEAASIIEAAELRAAETLVRTEEAVAAMVEDAHRLAAQIVDSAQLEADHVVADAGARIGSLDETAKALSAAIIEMKERFEGREPVATADAEIVEDEAGKSFKLLAVDESGDAVAVHEEEIAEPYVSSDSPIIEFAAEQAAPAQRRRFQIFRRA